MHKDKLLEFLLQSVTLLRELRDRKAEEITVIDAFLKLSLIHI